MLVNTARLSALTGLSPYAIRRMVKAGVLPVVNVGSFSGGRERWRFNVDAVMSALASRSEADRQEREAAALAEASAWR